MLISVYTYIHIHIYIYHLYIYIDIPITFKDLSRSLAEVPQIPLAPSPPAAGYPGFRPRVQNLAFRI